MARKLSERKQVTFRAWQHGAEKQSFHLTSELSKQRNYEWLL